MREQETIFSSGLETIKSGKVTTRKQLFELFNEGFKEGLWKAAKETAIAYVIGLGLLMATFPLFKDKVQFDDE